MTVYKVKSNVVELSIGKKTKIIIYLKKGERLRVDNDVYLDNESDNRVYLDYEKYYMIYNLAKLFGKIRVYGMKFVYEKGLGYVANNFNQHITPDYIFFHSGKQIFITKEGLKIIEVQKQQIEKGECRTSILGNIAICYGDPE